MDDDTHEQLFGWFHHFADAPRETLVATATPANRARLSAMTKVCLTEPPVLGALSPEDFADYVLCLRANERRWNQALSDTLIRADDLFQSEGKPAAVAALRTFASSCPWSSFRIVALDQAASHDRRL
jgi:hypothetical protein